MGVFHHGRLEIITDILFKFKLKLKIHTKQTEFRHKFSQKLHHVHKKLQQVHKKLTKPLKIFQSILTKKCPKPRNFGPARLTNQIELLPHTNAENQTRQSVHPAQLHQTINLYGGAVVKRPKLTTTKNDFRRTGNSQFLRTGNVKILGTRKTTPTTMSTWAGPNERLPA